MEKIRILFVLSSMHNGGTEAFVMNYYRRLNKGKFDIDFMVLQDKEEYFKDEIGKTGSTIYHLSFDGGQYEKNYFKAKDFFAVHKYDIVHIHSCSLRFLILMAFVAQKEKAGIIIGHAHSVGEPKGNICDDFIRLIMKRCISRFIDYGMACSGDSAEAKYTTDFINSKKFFMVPNAIDTAKFAYNEDSRKKIRTLLGLEGKFVVGIVGRLEKGKNQSFLMDAVKIANQNCEVYMLAVGDGAIRHDLEKQAADLGIVDKVIFTGAVANAHDYYSAMDLFCLPSYVEGFPFVLVEAQANGLKCLISDSITRETNISKTSEFIPINNSTIWAEHIVNNFGSRLSQDNIQLVREQYDIRCAAEKLQNIYINIIENNDRHV